MSAKLWDGSKFIHVHAHSHFSALDALSHVPAMVASAKKDGNPGLGLTDHGNMAGAVQLYKACAKAGIKAYPGFEGYLIDPSRTDWESPEKKAPPIQRYHFGLLALTERGYQGLVKFNSLSHTRPRFNRFPRHSFSDLLQFGEEYGDDVVLTTGCFFGLIQQNIALGHPEMASRYIGMLAHKFPHLFVEVQNHNICHEETDDGIEYAIEDDAEIVDELFTIADDHGLPIVATQDSHYLKQRQKSAHTLMKSMVYSSQEDGFPGDSFHLASAEWVAEHYTQKQWNRIEESFKELDDMWDLHIEPLDNYKIHVPTISRTPNTDIKNACIRRLRELNLHNDPKYVKQTKYELNVIKKLGMGNYFVIVADGVKWCQDRHIMVESRGSANGSLVCYLLGITQVDPLVKGGMFERFLSYDRTKPPDVDIDIEDEGRGQLLDYWLTKYGAVQIGTWGLLGTSIDKETGEERGSVVQTWITSKRRECEQIAKRWAEKQEERFGKKPKAPEIVAYGRGVFNKKYGDVTSIEDVRDIAPDDYKALRELSQLEPYKSYGTHAGGVLLSGDDIKIEDYIPTMLVASSDTRVTQYSMDDVEAFGLLKMDVLGQTSLRMMKLCQDMMGREDPTDFQWIPEDDPDACKLLRDGRTKTGVFHFEGYTKAKGGREMKVKSTEDAIMVQALYMPGAMESGQTEAYIKRRFSAQARREITYLSPEFEKALERTYGTVIFQEQVLEVMRNFGLDTATINTAFAILKDSGRGSAERNRDRIAQVRPLFDAKVRPSGVDPDEAWDFLAGFASYGFNRAHASAYGIRSYRTAYLKAHHTVEFMTALLQVWAGRDKERDYVREARRLGIRILPADVNVSGALWTMDPDRPGVIRKGLLSISGIGDKAAAQIAAEAPFKSIEDLVERVPARAMTGGKKWLETGEWSGILKVLKEAEALESLGE
ncbi:DnaE-like DNA polymerase III alpha [Gordonia phage ChisanaKitsune]|uniref:DNA-directed DNA polymerase n=1 Tax=Gordonia phage ChisanaKitsune TaxID=2871538 RepID=A0AAE7XGD0_9CAUD|nr:DnaE-like DNA polymerase III alpha [Gordonia phage ChisanaKitsune]QZE10859.1 DnaE-like DNA polymerase III alpha [Gordonia phage ChisanaKitsune]